MNKAILNSELIAIKAGDIIIYNYDGETREYISTSTEYPDVCGMEFVIHDYEIAKVGEKIGLNVDPYEIHLMKVHDAV